MIATAAYFSARPAAACNLARFTADGMVAEENRDEFATNKIVEAPQFPARTVRER
jgi:hypothetical protein